MSKNIIIQEGGIAKQLTADKLKTNLSGGGTCLWVPEDELQLTTKHITENGTYRASDDGYYGYSEVMVNGVGSVTGRDPTTGEEVEVHRDPTTGEIMETVIPTEIRVIEPPTNPYGTYIDGQAITKDGMVVKAYSANGVEIQTVPVGEITLNPTTAHNESGQEYATSDLDTGSFSQPIPLSPVATVAYTSVDGRYRHTNTFTPINGAVMVIMTNTQNKTEILGASSVSQEVIQLRDSGIDDRTGEQSVSFIRQRTSRSATYDGKTVHYVEWIYSTTAGKDFLVNPVIENYGNNNFAAQAAWTAVYGEITPYQTITVSWPRPGDGKVLETSFEILVAPPYSTEE